MLLEAHQDLVLIPCQKAALSPQEGSCVEGAVVLDSPPYSPSPSESERPILSARLEGQLRRACAVIVRETNPSGQEFIDLPDYNETLKRLNEEHENAQKFAAAVRARLSKPQPQAPFSHRPGVDGSEPSSKPPPYVDVPQNAAASLEATAGRRQPLSPLKPKEIDSKRLGRVISGTDQNARLDREDQSSKLRVAVDTRPKTSAAAGTDYAGPLIETGSSTSRSTTTYGGSGRPTSTGLSSLAVTPDNKIPSSRVNTRVSEQILHDGPSASLADASAKAWMAQELSRRCAECGNERSARPKLQTSTQQKQSEPERPSSRASKLASGIAGSVRDSIKDYIRPRPSTDGPRSAPSNQDPPRPSSCDGREGKGGEKNRWSGSGFKEMESRHTYRLWQPALENPFCLEQMENPDLNRALPALPGLDQYKEKRDAPKHISQLMRSGRQDAGRQAGAGNAKEQTSAMPEDAYRQYLAQAERKKQLMDSRRAVEAKMRQNALLASANSVVSPPTRPTQPPRRKPDGPFVSDPSITIVEVSRAPAPAEKKQGLRKRLSRFWGHGVEKDRENGRGR